MFTARSILISIAIVAVIYFATFAMSFRVSPGVGIGVAGLIMMTVPVLYMTGLTYLTSKVIGDEV